MKSPSRTRSAPKLASCVLRPSTSFLPTFCAMISAPTDLPTSPQAPDWMAEIWWRRSTGAISWARTPASSDSLASRFTRPCETITVPPGMAKALIVSVSITPKVQGRSGFSVWEASQRPTRFT